ncbi:hypothetical protein Esti_001968 [Eimeria stiedai]
MQLTQQLSPVRSTIASTGKQTLFGSNTGDTADSATGESTADPRTYEVQLHFLAGVPRLAAAASDKPHPVHWEQFFFDFEAGASRWTALPKNRWNELLWTHCDKSATEFYEVEKVQIRMKSGSLTEYESLCDYMLLSWRNPALLLCPYIANLGRNAYVEITAAGEIVPALLDTGSARILLEANFFTSHRLKGFKPCAHSENGPLLDASGNRIPTTGLWEARVACLELAGCILVDVVRGPPTKAVLGLDSLRTLELSFLSLSGHPGSSQRCSTDLSQFPKTFDALVQMYDGTEARLSQAEREQMKQLCLYYSDMECRS